MTRFGPVVRKCRRWSSWRVQAPECSRAGGTGTRRALFVGLWPPMLWLIGDGVYEHE